MLDAIYIYENALEGNIDLDTTKKYTKNFKVLYSAGLEKHKIGDMISLRDLVKYAIKKYGSENFKVEILEIASSLEELIFLEKYYIKFFNSISPFGYNLTEGGETFGRSEEGKKSFFEEKRGKGSIGRPRKTNLDELTYEELQALVDIQHEVIESLKKKRALVKGK